MESCVSVRRKEVKSERIIWKGSWMKKMIWIMIIMDEDSVECPVVCVSREEVLQALNEMKTGKAPSLQKYH